MIRRFGYNHLRQQAGLRLCSSRWAATASSRFSRQAQACFLQTSSMTVSCAGMYSQRSLVYSPIGPRSWWQSEQCFFSSARSCTMRCRLRCRARGCRPPDRFLVSDAPPTGFALALSSSLSVAFRFGRLCFCLPRLRGGSKQGQLVGRWLNPGSLRFVAGSSSLVQCEACLRNRLSINSSRSSRP